MEQSVRLARGAELVLSLAILVENFSGIELSGLGTASFTVKKLECLKQAYAVEYISME